MNRGHVPLSSIVHQYSRIRVLDLNYLVEELKEDVFHAKYASLNEAIVSVIQDYSLVSFSTLHVDNKESMLKLMKVIDKANGYFYGGLSKEGDDVMEMMSKAVGADLRFNQPTDHGMSMQDMIKEMVQGQQLEQ